MSVIYFNSRLSQTGRRISCFRYALCGGTESLYYSIPEKREMYNNEKIFKDICTWCENMIRLKTSMS